MTKELRERFDKKFNVVYEASKESYLRDNDAGKMFAFIEQEIIEAERRGREKMRREVIWQCQRELAYNGASGHDDGDVYIERCIKRIENTDVDLPAISSL